MKAGNSGESSTPGRGVGGACKTLRVPDTAGTAPAESATGTRHDTRASGDKPSVPPKARTPRRLFYAVRKGKTVQSCLFWKWADCRNQVYGTLDGDNSSDTRPPWKPVYACFASLLQAETYLQCSTDEGAQAYADRIQRIEPEPPSAVADKADGNSESGSQTTDGLRISNQNLTTAPATTMQAQPAAEPQAPASLPTPKPLPAWAKEPLTQDPPSKYWWEIYFFLSAYRKRHENLHLEQDKVEALYFNSDTKTIKDKQQVKALNAINSSFAKLFSLPHFWIWCRHHLDSYRSVSTETEKASLQEATKVKRLTDLGLDWKMHLVVVVVAEQVVPQPASSSYASGWARRKAALPPRKRPRLETQAERHWYKMYDIMLDYHEEHGTFVVSPEVTDLDAAQLKQLCRWIQQQRLSYQKIKQGKGRGKQNMSLTDDRIRELEALGFPFDGPLPFTHDSSLTNSEGNIKLRTRKPHKKWESMFARLKTHLQQGNTPLQMETATTTASDEDETNPTTATTAATGPTQQGRNGNGGTLKELIAWVKDQQAQYVALREGKTSSMSDEKIHRLREIGLPLVYFTFQERIEQLNTFLKENGNPSEIPKTSSDLHKWSARMKSQLQKISDGKEATDLTMEQVNQLKRIPFFANSYEEPRDISQETSGKRDSKWDEMYLKMKEYKEQHGDCLISTSNYADPLVKWVTAQRRYYRTLKEKGKSAHLDARKLQLLHEIGFVFRQKGSYKTFDERMVELMEFQAQHGHLRVPTNKSGLGAFVATCRDQFRMSRQGKKCSMNEEKFSRLKAIGFEFQVGKSPIRTYPRHTWQERFQQLQAYKQEFGDTMVPQSFSGYNNLGQWVKTQRENYRTMRRGKKSPMTSEMALRLSELGFKWEIANGKRKRGS